MLSDQSQRNFRSWAQTRAGTSINHIQLIDPILRNNRSSILKKADDLGAQLFSSYFQGGSRTVIGSTEGWTIDELTKNGWPTKKCNEVYMPGVALCLPMNTSIWSKQISLKALQEIQLEVNRDHL